MSVIKQFGPNWFTTVMGVGIVAGLTYTSPFPIPFQHPVGEVLFAVLNVVFAVALLLWFMRWILHPHEALDDFRHPGRALFYGAFAMGINVVGNDYLLVGTHILNSAMAIEISKAIWVAGTIVSIFTVIVVPYLLFTEHDVKQHEALATWLIPVVPPIVAAATGANLIPYWGGTNSQFSVTALILAMFGTTFFLFIMVSGLVYARLVYHKRLSGEAAPSLWVEIGPIGMSMGTFSTLPVTTHAILGPYGNALHALGMAFSIALWGVGVWWIVISSMHTFLHLSKRGEGLPFHMGWWSYVFPIGSFTSGTYALGHLVGYPFFTIVGLVQLLILWGCFVIVFSRTAHGVWSGALIQWRRTPVRISAANARKPA
ncbi:C4-dicarboxylate ABC transporter [Alicyclobacillus sp. ALC3]|uniref:SLAC1 family transporter n=1 Tax=Alicyclobacillus sp. ALC3 TaxID=2796143 RepID=UPI00237A02B6|nr:C4-dicarboxylate ABC transporter [Alicyclobacillus sp. ALC3]WDL99129.1 C4-dicarboxylate ABC transporter [Alicyclobacillus sp. ALC3]